MSKTLRLARARRAGILLASGIACGVVPAVASASAVNLGSAAPFAVLGGSGVSNTGPSVLDGDLGVSPETAITGFPPGIVNGAIHDDDAVAAQAQQDALTAYGVAAGQAVPTGNYPSGHYLTGQDLGGLTLTPGAYRFSTSAQLTGQLTLNALGNPRAQFVFEIGSTLTTASFSSVRLINGASPCNVYWQVGSSATLGTSTAFEGNVLALASVTANTSATVQGRLLALNAAVTLDTNTVDRSMCDTSITPPPGSTPPGSTPPGSTPPGSTPTPISTPPTAIGAPPSRQGKRPPPASHSTVPTRTGTATLTRTRPPSSLARCNFGFTATVRGHNIKRVVFTLDGKVLATRTASRFSVHVPAAFAGSGHLRARVTFKDATRAQTLALRYQACAAAVVQPLPAPSTFTG